MYTPPLIMTNYGRKLVQREDVRTGSIVTVCIRDISPPGCSTQVKLTDFGEKNGQITVGYLVDYNDPSSERWTYLDEIQRVITY